MVSLKMSCSHYATVHAYNEERDTLETRLLVTKRCKAHIGGLR
jgi:hypothetical protein